MSIISLPMPKATNLIILGIDPGLATTGFGVVERRGSELQARSYGTIDTGAREPFGERLQTIYQGVQTLIKRWKPDVIAVEELFYHRNATTAFAVGQARGVVVLAAIQAHRSVVSCKPLQVKRAITGYGQATKNQMQQSIANIFKLNKIPKPDDAADALAVALCGERLARTPQ